MVAKKRKSKRQTLQNKYKISKRTKEHKRKIQKGKLKVANYGQRAKAKDHIPNNWPYKEDLLKEIQVAKEKMEEMKQRQKERKAEERAARKSGGMHVEYEDDDGDNSEMDEDTGAHGESAGDGEDNDEGADLYQKDGGQNSRRAFMRDLRKVTEQADVILHVLDARDPAGTKSTVIEDMVLSNYRKKLVFVLNKADLVPKEVLAGWLKFFRQTSPAVPFKCNTQTQKGNLGRAGGRVPTKSDNASVDSLRTSQAVGADELIGLLKNYARIGDKTSSKHSINVGIVGFPNVGKSSLINSLMRARAVGVSSMPGFTKSVSEVILDKNIRLLDSPGVVFAAGSGAGTALRNCINVESMDDVITPVQAILERCPQPYLMQLYSISRFKDKDALSFLALVARGQGKLRKGGIPNTDAAARTVLHDWNSGRIKFYTKAPEVASASKAQTSKILDKFSEELDVKQLIKDGEKVINTLEEMEEEGDEEFVAVDELGEAEMEMGDGSSEEEEDKIATMSKSTTAKKPKTVAGVKAKATAAPKAAKKKRSNEDYSFNEYF